MRIAQVAPLNESVPPKRYGGTERIVSYLTEELVARGHDVTLFASEDSTTSARLVAPSSTSLRLREDCLIPEIYHTLLMEAVFSRADEFDVIHFHTGHIHFPFLKHYRGAHVTTLHGRLDIKDLIPLFATFPDVPVVSISDAQRRPLPELNWQATVPHGLPETLYTFRDDPEEYLLFIGRISPEKRLDRAIEIACRCDLPLRVGAKVDRADTEYFEREIRHLLDHPLVDFIGEVDEQQKNELLGRARALLFPIDWPEPFGLVMIEAFACGTPVIAYPHGSVREVMKDGVSGYVVESVDEAVEAVGRTRRFDRAGCRAYFEARFTAGTMCRAYLEVYHRLLEAERVAVPVSLANGHATGSARLPGGEESTHQ